MLAQLIFSWTLDYALHICTVHLNLQFTTMFCFQYLRVINYVKYTFALQTEKEENESIT